MAHAVFEEAVRAFSTEITKDYAKRKWLTESKHGDLQDVLVAVVGAKDQYEKRTSASGTRDVLVSFSEKLHHYSAIMDVLVQHHPEYASLAWGAMKILFVVSEELYLYTLVGSHFEHVLIRCEIVRDWSTIKSSSRGLRQVSPRSPISCPGLSYS